MDIETLLGELESAANFMRGMTFDRRLHPEIKKAVLEKCDELDAYTEKALIEGGFRAP